MTTTMKGISFQRRLNGQMYLSRHTRLNVGRQMPPLPIVLEDKAHDNMSTSNTTSTTATMPWYVNIGDTAIITILFSSTSATKPNATPPTGQGTFVTLVDPSTGPQITGLDGYLTLGVWAWTVDFSQSTRTLTFTHDTVTQTETNTVAYTNVDSSHPADITVATQTGTTTTGYMTVTDGVTTVTDGDRLVALGVVSNGWYGESTVNSPWTNDSSKDYDNVSIFSLLRPTAGDTGDITLYNPQGNNPPDYADKSWMILVIALRPVLYAGVPPVPSQIPVLAYSLDENTGTVAHDSSGNGRDGVAYGWTTGHTNSGAGGDSTHPSVVCTSSMLSSPTALTVMFWWKLTNNGSMDIFWLADAVYGSGPTRFLSMWNESAHTHWSVTTGVSEYDVQGVGPLPLNTWAHVALVLDSGTANFYIDGTLSATTAYSGSLDATLDSLILGGLPGDVQDVGVADDVRIFDVAMSVGDIIAWANIPVS